MEIFYTLDSLCDDDVLSGQQWLPEWFVSAECGLRNVQIIMCQYFSIYSTEVIVENVSDSVQINNARIDIGNDVLAVPIDQPLSINPWKAVIPANNEVQIEPFCDFPSSIEDFPDDLFTRRWR